MQEIISAAELIDSYDKNKTKEAFITSFKKYMNHIYPDKNPEKYNELSIRYIKELKKGRDPIKDLKEIISEYKTKYETGTTKLYIHKIVYWMEINEIKINKWNKKTLRNTMPKATPEYEEGELTREKILEIYNYSSDRNRILILIMTSSGARINEAASIRYEDIDFESEPVRIRLRPENTKNGKGRTILISSEAEKEIINYTRKKGITKGELYKNATVNFRNEWYKKIRRIETPEYIKSKMRYKIHIHMFRKWFLSQFKLYASSEIGELLAGHEGYLTSSYRRYTKEEIAEEYRKAEKALSILKDYRIITECSGNAIEGACYEC